MARIIIVDEQEWMRESLKVLFAERDDFEIVAEGTDGYDALKICEEHQPDVAVVSLELALLDGIKVCPSIKLRSSKTSIIIFAKTVSTQSLMEINGSGASGIILRRYVYEELIGALQYCSKSKDFYVGRDIAPLAMQLLALLIEERTKKSDNVNSAMDQNVIPISINKIELQIAACIGKGYSNKEIASLLEFKEGTVRNYISLILQKTGLKHRTQIAIYAFNNGFTNQFEFTNRNKKPKPAAKKHKAHASKQPELLAAENIINDGLYKPA